MSFEVPGFLIEQLIGFGGSGEVWRARDERSGALVALKRLRSDSHAHGDPESRDRLRREAALLAGLAGPHVLPMRDLLITEHGPVLVLDYAEGGSLAGLLGARGRLEPAELVTLGVPLARTLRDLHARGVVHGDISPANVLLTGDGRPMLADLGVARLLGETPRQAHGTDGYVDPLVRLGGPVTAASDVYALGTLLTEVATGQPLGDASAALLVDVVPPAVVRTLTACVSPVADERPAAAEVAEVLLTIGTPAPIRLAPVADVLASDLPVTTVVTPAPPAPPPAAAGPRRLPSRRALTTAAAALLLVAASVVAGLIWARSSGSEALASVGAARRAAPATDWRAVVDGLDQVRDDAFTAGDPDELEAAYLQGSGAMATESARLRALLDQRLVVRGLELQLVSVRPLSVADQRVVLEVTDRLAAYDLLDAAGHLVAHRPARTARTWRLELAAHGTAWRIASVAPAVAPAVG
ncbi:MAG: eukaryotic-like serine/threonine-protein kinase [Frankiales bacterium]|nr:eukaryotic-like serine/threonine-protein kinase [Frankiales bacterium]